MRLVRLDEAHLPGYIDALNRGWSPDSAKGSAAATVPLERIEADRAGFLAELDDREGKGAADQALRRIYRSTAHWVPTRRVPARNPGVFPGGVRDSDQLRAPGAGPARRRA